MYLSLSSLLRYNYNVIGVLFGRIFIRIPYNNTYQRDIKCPSIHIFFCEFDTEYPAPFRYIYFCQTRRKARKNISTQDSGSTISCECFAKILFSAEQNQMSSKNRKMSSRVKFCLGFHPSIQAIHPLIYINWMKGKRK